MKNKNKLIKKKILLKNLMLALNIEKMKRQELCTILFNFTIKIGKLQLQMF